jgi:hypothetical protein
VFLMTIDAIFAQALAKHTPAERTAYLDEACAHDAMLRQRVETLLRSHEAAGDFLGKPAIQYAAEELAGPACAEETQGEPPVDDGDREPLGFLASSDKPGSLGRLGHYEVLEIIGRGGMGIVLRAFDGKLHRVVAIKVMAAQLAINATARKRFTREAQAAAAVTHDHIVTIHAVEEANGLPYLVMQYVSGLTLQQRLDRSGPLELREIVRIGMQTAAGLAAAHAHGLIHRDIKPANILLENSVERVKITDFGLARAVADASLTQSWVVAGTPHYMSPEQARGEVVDQRTDLFSLGSLLYAMCMGRPPFRADSIMAVLKRVCEEMPSAIRETNSEIPDWLVAIVNKLLAKAPADRFQSAAEVAALLKDHLAHLQHPSVVGPAAGNLASPSGKVAGGEGVVCQPAPRRRRWALVGAALLLCFVGGLGFAEGTGVTNLRATVIRIFTPEGTLIVEVNDPGVKVTIEGDGGIVIAGAGLQEVRLKPGSYKVHAIKGGKPVRLDQELITITRGDKQVVRVQREAEAAGARIAAEAELGTFVLLGGKGVTERKFDTLGEAVQGSSDGDTIEIHGNGPFVCGPLSISNALTIRAGKGFRPRILRAETQPDVGFLLENHAPLNLEGLELEIPDRDQAELKIPDRDQVWPSVVICRRTSIQAANCRFLVRGLGISLNYGDSVVAVARNCEFIGGTNIAICGNSLPAGAQRVMENCVVAGITPMYIDYSKSNESDIFVRLIHNTFVINKNPVISFRLGASVKIPAVNPQRQPITIDLSSNILQAKNLIWLHQLTNENAIEPVKAEAAFRLLSDWREHQNLDSLSGVYLTSKVAEEEPDADRFQNRTEWDRFWGSDHTGAQEGQVRYQGGNLLARLAREPEKLGPEDFRLRPDSAGYRAGDDGKDLGADIDLVGPGPAYDRWQKTPAYQQWLQDTGQMKK